jgi:hypothetical protein
MNARLMLAGMLGLVAGIVPASGGDIESGGGIRPYFMVYSGPPCRSWDPKDEPNGQTNYSGYCGNRNTPGYHVQRDTYSYYSGHIPVVSLKLLLTCGVDAMPQRARDLYCRPPL